MGELLLPALLTADRYGSEEGSRVRTGTVERRGELEGYPAGQHGEETVVALYICVC